MTPVSPGGKGLVFRFVMVRRFKRREIKEGVRRRKRWRVKRVINFYRIRQTIVTGNRLPQTSDGTKKSRGSI